MKKDAKKLMKLLEEYIYTSIAVDGKFIFFNVATFEVKETYTTLEKFKWMKFQKVKIKPSALLHNITKKKWFQSMN